MLRVGQPVWPAVLVFHLCGRGASRPQHDGEQLVTTSQLQQAVAKGQPLDARFGPCCVSGPHLLCVLLNGAHVGGSPIEVRVAAAVPLARACTVHGPGRTGKLRTSCVGVAGGAIRFRVVLRDRHGNAVADEVACDVAALRGLSASLSLRAGSAADCHSKYGSGPDWLPRGRAAEEVAGAEAEAEAEAAAGEGAEVAEVGPCVVAAGQGGALCVTVVCRRAGVYDARLQLHGAPVGETMVVHVEPAAACAAACTLHALPPPPPPSPPGVLQAFLSRPFLSRAETDERAPPSPSPPSPPSPASRPQQQQQLLLQQPAFLSSCRVICGDPAMLLLAARDALGNLRRAPASSWTVALEAAEGEAPPPLHACVERTEGEHSLLRFTAGGPGLTAPTTVRLVAAHRGAPVRGAPLRLTLLPPAFGLGLHRATAGEAARFWVYLGAAPRVAPNGSYAEEQQALQSVRVELRNDDDPSARVELSVVPPELRALRGEAAWAGAADQLAEVRYVCASAGPRWRMHVSVDGAAVCGSPFGCDVRPARPCLARSQLHAPWVGSGQLIAGGQQQGVLQLRDALCNKCDVGVGGRVTATLTRAPCGLEGSTDYEGEAEDDDLENAMAADLGDGCYAVTLLARRVGLYALTLELDSHPLACSRLVQVVAAAAEARGSMLHLPPSGVLQPGQWNALRLRCADGCGNSSAPRRQESVRLHGRCLRGGGAVQPEHLVLREADGAYDESAGEFVVWVFGWPISRLEIGVTLDGEHVAGSPALLDVTAGGAAPGRCYARGEGVEALQRLCSGRQPHRFAIVACDATGLPRSHGGDAFDVRVLPHGHAHHVSPTSVTVHDQGDGVHLVQWLPPFSGDYLVHVTLGGLHIYGSPFPCTLRGAAPGASARERAGRSPQAHAHVRSVAWGDEPSQPAQPARRSRLVQPARPAQPARPSASVPPALLPRAQALHATRDGPTEMLARHRGAQGGAQGDAPSRSSGAAEAAPVGSPGDCPSGEPASSLAPGIMTPFSPPPCTLPVSPSSTVLTPLTSAPAPPRPPQAARLVERPDHEDAAAPVRAAQLRGESASEEEDHGSLKDLIAALRQTVAMLDEGESEGE